MVDSPTYLGSKNSSPAPAQDFFAITPHDTTNFDNIVRGIYVGVSGDVTIVPADGGTAVTFKNAIQGTVLPVRASRVNDTDTDATDLVGLY